MKKSCLLTSVCFVVISACSGKSDSSSSGLSSIPAVAPLVRSSLPASLQAAASTNFMSAVVTTPASLFANSMVRPMDARADAVANVAILFKTGSYGKISGGNGYGYVNSLLEDLDSRFTELKQRFDSAPGCFSNAVKSHTFDLSGVYGGANASVTSMLKLSLDLQCYDLFDTSNAGEQSGDGSGMVFGHNGNDYSLGLLLNEKGVSDSGFGYVAKVTGKDTDDETVDLLFGEGRPSGSSNGNNKAVVARLKAKSKKGYYELAFASNAAGNTNPTSGGSANYGCGMHGITDGTYVFLSGLYQPTGSCGSAGGVSYEVCLKASDLTESAASSDCDAIKAAMTIGTESEIGDLDYSEVTTSDSSTITTALQFNTDSVKADASSVQ